MLASAAMLDPALVDFVKVPSSSLSRRLSSSIASCDRVAPQICVERADVALQWRQASLRSALAMLGDDVRLGAGQC